MLNRRASSAPRPAFCRLALPALLTLAVGSAAAAEPGPGAGPSLGLTIADVEYDGNAFTTMVVRTGYTAALGPRSSLALDWPAVGHVDDYDDHDGDDHTWTSIGAPRIEYRYLVPLREGWTLSPGAALTPGILAALANLGLHNGAPEYLSPYVTEGAAYALSEPRDLASLASSWAIASLPVGLAFDPQTGPFFSLEVELGVGLADDLDPELHYVAALNGGYRRGGLEAGARASAGGSPEADLAAGGPFVGARLGPVWLRGTVTYGIAASSSWAPDADAHALAGRLDASLDL